MPFNITPVHLLLILGIVLIIVGPGKLPEVGSAFGKALNEFRKSSSDLQEAVQSPSTAAPAPTTMSSSSMPNAYAAADAGAVAGARNVTPRGTPTEPIDDRA
jgi:sec-independent protein translocase protein TatA